jgi:hypothetical protein
MLALPLSASPSLSGCTTAQRNRIVADLIAAATARERAVMVATHEDQTLSHRQWIEYLKSICLYHDPFLDRFNRCQQNLLICAFGTAVREGRFSSNAIKTLADGTVRNTISSICSAFQEHGRPNPSTDKDLQSCFLLQQQYRSNVNDNPKQKHQKKPYQSASLLKLQNKRALNCSGPLDSSPPLQFSLPCKHACI